MADPELEPHPTSPDPRTVSREIMTRHEFQVASGLNALTAAWLGFIDRDATAIYATDADASRRVRSGSDGKLNAPHDDGATPDAWLGPRLLTSLFTREHNAICDELIGRQQSGSDDDLFERARLANLAVIAKIHHDELVPALTGAARTTGNRRTRWFARVAALLGRHTDNGASRALADLPASARRVPALVPDDWTLRSARDDEPLAQYPLRELTGPRATELEHHIGMTDLLYSLGRAPTGTLRLHNLPHDLQDLPGADGTRSDLGAEYVQRGREHDVPRYLEFRRRSRLAIPRTFEALTDHPRWADELRRVYGDDLERIDLAVGMLAEPLPEGSAIGDTARRIIRASAPRPLNGDSSGIDAPGQARLSAVLLRHCPDLAPALSTERRSCRGSPRRRELRPPHPRTAGGRHDRRALPGPLLPRRL